jgi:hypothetical protein
MGNHDRNCPAFVFLYIICILIENEIENDHTKARAKRATGGVWGAGAPGRILGR